MVGRWPKIGIGLALVSILCLTVGLQNRARALNITIDYKYDLPANGGSNFFCSVTGITCGNQEGQAGADLARAALQTAASRWSAIITTSLSAVSLTDDATDARIGFENPSTGNSFQISSALSAATDAVVSVGKKPAANEYRGPWSIAANQWILYPGARNLGGAAGEGGSFGAANFDIVYQTSSSVWNRGFRSTGTGYNLPMWGGAIAFDTSLGTSWSFDVNNPSPTGIDFYTFALHEIGHALGLASGATEWTNLSSGGLFSGPQAVGAYNQDNGTSLSTLAEVSSADPHWKDQTYKSYIFHNASPRYAGTGGADALQDLLMDPNQNFITPTTRRFELTNVDVAALRDVGWSVVPNLAGDFNADDRVNIADYTSWRKGNGAVAAYREWRTSFGATGVSGADNLFAAVVPEPSSSSMIVVVTMLVPLVRRRHS